MNLRGLFEIFADHIAPIFVGRDGMGGCHGSLFQQTGNPQHKPTQK